MNGVRVLRNVNPFLLMKSHLRLLLLLTTFFTLPLHADDAAEILAADDARISAMQARDAGKLDAIFSADLHYAHSNGVVDTKASFMEVLTSGATRYVGYDHVERKATFPTPGVALVSGRARIQAETAKGAMDSVLSYLSVWRLEEGKWRFLAWQSCRLPPAEK